MSDDEKPLSPAQQKVADRKAAAEARAAELDAETKAVQLGQLRREQVLAMIPDLSSIDNGATTAESPAFSVPLAGRALTAAAAQLIGPVKGALGDNFRVVVTPGTDLTARDAALQTVRAELEHTIARIEEFTTTNAPPEAIDVGVVVEGILPVLPAVIGAAAAAVPALVNLFATSHTLTTSTGTLDDTTASIAVAGTLAASDPGAAVYLHGTEPLPAGSEIRSLYTRAGELVANLSTAVGHLVGDSDAVAAYRSAATALIDSANAVLTGLAQAADGPSPLVTAQVHEALLAHEVGYILGIQGGATSADQVVSDRKVGSDTISVTSTATLAYVLTDRRHPGRVLRAGTVSGIAHLHGKPGELRLGSAD